MKSKVTEKEQCVEIFTKFNQFMKDGKPKAVKEYLLKIRHELRNSNK